MMYAVRPSTRFQKDLKRIQKRGYDLSLLTNVIKKLAAGEELPPKNRDHQLVGDYGGCRECHIAPDWLLVYEIDGTELIPVSHPHRHAQQSVLMTKSTSAQPGALFANRKPLSCMQPRGSPLCSFAQKKSRRFSHGMPCKSCCVSAFLL